jgi:spore germination cell wall hydrolase CwlJ-like protein
VRLTLIAAGMAAAVSFVARADAASAPKPEAVACLTEALYHETRGNGERAAYAVAHVVLNRREHEEFPETVCAVIADGCEFSYRCDGKPESFTEDKEAARAGRVAEAVLAGESSDPTDGALFFHAEGIEPGWFESRDRTAEIGGNVFYR